MPKDAKLDECEFLVAYAAHVRRRLTERPSLVSERPVSPRPSPYAWFLARVDATAAGLATVETHGESRDFATPWQVNSNLMLCQKPFQLWNVNRAEHKDPIAFEKGLKYAIGHAVVDFAPGRDGRPGTVTPAGVLAARAEQEAAKTRDVAWSRRRHLWEQLAKDAALSGLGRSDGSSKPKPSSESSKPKPSSEGFPMNWTAPPDFGK
jgi:hypothetical protein